MLSFLKRSSGALLVLLLLPAAVSAQAAITGVVKDASGAVVPGATIEVRNTATNRSRMGISSDAGEYVIADLDPGVYQITAQLTGFRKWASTLTLRTLQTAVVDIALQIGEVTNEVRVEDATPVLNAAEGTLADVKEAERIKALPLNGRDLAALFVLTPGVTRTGGTGPVPRR